MILLRKRERERCAVCGRELTHKHRPAKEWALDGFLCGDCHLNLMRDYYVEGKVPRRKGVACDLCGKEVEPEDLHEPHRGLNLKGRICTECLEGRQREVEKKLDRCAVCGKKLGFFRYNPKEKWRIDGHLCKKCWDARNGR